MRIGCCCQSKVTHTDPCPIGQRPVSLNLQQNPKPNTIIQSVLQRHFRQLNRSEELRMMQRTVFRRAALLAQQAALESSLPTKNTLMMLRLDRCMSSVSIPPPACMLRPLETPFRYLFGPGPSNVPPRVLAAGGRPIIGHLHPEMYEV